jgi:hypothetical protein
VKNPLRLVATLVCAALLLGSGALAQSENSSRKKYLLADWATEKDGTLVVDEHHRCKVRPRTGWGTTKPFTFTFHFRSEAGTENFSRDRFVALSARAKWIMLGRTGERYPGISGMDAMGAVKCEPTKQAISDPDQEVKVFMGPHEIRMEVWDGRKGSGDRMTDTWENVLGF